ncbi:MAG: EF-hand domain-containing protein [Candidatus Wallbacteria bacterium]|nr:EF-hand domain-containing protein [Candidatus Wallbacteria bacterium]
MIRIAILSVFLLLFSLVLAADKKPAAPQNTSDKARPAGQMPPQMGRMNGFRNIDFRVPSFEELDRDHNGTLDRDEFAVCMQELTQLTSIVMQIRQIVGGAGAENRDMNGGMMQQFILKKFDTDKNGHLDSKEISAWNSARQTIEKKYDQSGKGQIEPQQRKAMMEEIMEMLGMPAPPQNPQTPPPSPDGNQ